ncbi:putative uridine kinase C227.14 [Vitis vinifera]|uniref:Putative uridine kinase C227.14 n=1 Tax=Vitis vinifera TaxID=29760 RepID=A0A438KI72_VITVI|nr:putative uridine kinase C227.14 [Vitis vinifera]
MPLIWGNFVFKGSKRGPRPDTHKRKGDSSAELLLLRKVKVPITYRCSVLNSPTRRSVQPLFGGTRSQFGRESCLKVSCSQKGEIPVVDGRCMDEIYDTLAERLLPTAAVASNPNLKLKYSTMPYPNCLAPLFFLFLLTLHADDKWVTQLSLCAGVCPSEVERFMQSPVTLAKCCWACPSIDPNRHRGCMTIVNEKLRIVGLAGPPGAGKSTLASEVAWRVNKLWPQKASSFDSQVGPPDVAAVLPMDGFHLYRHQLDAMEDPEEAHARRGAPWTFDPTRLLTCLKRLRHEGSVYAPSFDHGVGDPVEDDIFISLQHKVVIVEGNYLLLQEGDWKEVSSMFDEKWFIEVDIDTSMERVVKRHVSTGKPPDIAKWRIEYNDRPNAELIIKSKKNADLVIRSVNF